MAQVSAKFRNVVDGYGSRYLTYWCQGCNECHQVCIERAPGQQGPCWGFNGSLDAPTFTPSVLVTWGWPDEPKHICHTFITDGQVQFLGDCTHTCADQTLPLPDLPEHMQGDKWSDG